MNNIELYSITNERTLWLDLSEVPYFRSRWIELMLLLFASVVELSVQQFNSIAITSTRVANKSTFCGVNKWQQQQQQQQQQIAATASTTRLNT